MKLHLGGHLSWYDPQKRAWQEIPLPEPIALRELVLRLGLPAGEIATAAVNGQLVTLQTARVADTDRVELFPPIGGG